MTRIERQLEIDRSSTTVLELLTNPDRLPDWATMGD